MHVAANKSAVYSLHGRSLGVKSSKAILSNILNDFNRGVSAAISSKSTKLQKAEKDGFNLPEHDTTEPKQNAIVMDDYVIKIGSKSVKASHVDATSSKSSKDLQKTSNVYMYMPDVTDETETSTKAQLNSKSAKHKSQKASKSSSMNSSSFESTQDPMPHRSPTRMPSVSDDIVGASLFNTPVGLSMDSFPPTEFLDALLIESLSATTSPMLPPSSSTNSNASLDGTVVSQAEIATPTKSKLSNVTDANDFVFIDASRISEEESNITGAVAFSTKTAGDESNSILTYGLVTLSAMLILTTIGLIATRRKHLIDEVKKQEFVLGETTRSF